MSQPRCNGVNMAPFFDHLEKFTASIPAAAAALFALAAAGGAFAAEVPATVTAAYSEVDRVFVVDGVLDSPLYGIFVSTLLTLVVIPVLYYAAHWRCHIPAQLPTSTT